MDFITKDTVLNGRYSVKECIGEGGMAVVYRGWDIINEIEVALKVLKPELSGDEQHVLRFKSEAEAAYRLNHPNIIKIYGFGHFSGLHYIAMQLIDGVTLAEYMNSFGAIDWKSTFDISKQILSALSVAHEKGVIHRDIKPQNILVDTSGHVTLTDFGIAQDRVSDQTINANSSACSVHYISPEQARGAIVDGRSDIYSLGITMYEMLLGAVPFDGESPVTVALKHIQGRIIPPCEVDETIPKGVSDLVMVATMRDMGKRFQSAEEMLAQMNIVSENENISFWNNPYENQTVNEFVCENEDNRPASDGDLFENYTDDENINDDVRVYGKPEKEQPAENSEGQALSADSEKPGLDGEEDGIASEEFEYSELPKQTKTVRAGVIITYAAAAVLAIAAVIGLASLYNSLFSKEELVNQTYRIINYEGYKAAEVVAALKNVGINAELKTVVTDKYPAGYIVSQSVEADMNLREGDSVTFEVASSENFVLIENYVSDDYRAVKQYLINNGLNVDIKEVPGHNTKDGVIMRTVPGAGAVLSKGDSIVIYVTSGTVCAEVRVPDLISANRMTLEEARNTLESMNLKVGNVYPAPGENITVLFATPVPSAAPVPEYTAENGENYYSSETPANDAGEEDNDGTASPVNTGTPDAEPTPSPIFAKEYVVAQYPMPGTVLYEGDSVDLYFYEPEALNRAAGTVTETLECPENAVTDGIVQLIKFDYRLSDGSVYMDSMSKIPVESFPINFDVPYTYGSDVTEVYIYVNDMNTVYEKRIVYKREAQDGK